jgi:hypothetical protein
VSDNLVLSAEELRALTGYRVPSKQLQELRRQGFWRARRSPMTGRVILERSHYEAVTRGDIKKPEPMLRSERMRARSA